MNYLLCVPQNRWNSICVSRNCLSSLHADAANLPGSPNLSLSLGSFTGSSLWLEDLTCLHLDTPTSVSAGGSWLYGVAIDTCHKPLSFDGRVRHMMLPFQGERWALTAFTLSDVSCPDLEFLGFPLPADECCPSLLPSPFGFSPSPDGFGSFVEGASVPPQPEPTAEPSCVGASPAPPRPVGPSFRWEPSCGESAIPQAFLQPHWPPHIFPPAAPSERTVQWRPTCTRRNSPVASSATAGFLALRTQQAAKDTFRCRLGRHCGQKPPPAAGHSKATVPWFPSGAASSSWRNELWATSFRPLAALASATSSAALEARVLSGRFACVLHHCFKVRASSSLCRCRRNAFRAPADFRLPIGVALVLRTNLNLGGCAKPS